MTESLRPKNRGEAVAIFRSQVLGPLLSRALTRGELAAQLRELSSQTFRYSGSPVTRRFAVPTLQRWYYRYRAEGLAGLRPMPRRTGQARALTSEQRALLLDIRRERPRVPVSVLLRTLETDGRLTKSAVSEATVRRLFAAHGLDRDGVNNPTDNTNGVRLRWQAERPGLLWHADVCHGPALQVDGRSVPLRVHAILDDASRYIVAIAAVATEREVDMLALMVKALRLNPAPKVLYLDNGSTYSGQALATACARLHVNLVHARPYDPQARGKMERFWRTLRQGCLDHIGNLASLHDVQVRLLAFVDGHYHKAPHGALLGKTPAQSWETERDVHLEHRDDAQLRDALTVRQNRRVKRDGTVSVGGIDWEVTQGFLAGRNVVIGRTLFDPNAAPWIEHEESVYELHPVNAVVNGAQKRRRTAPERGVDAIPFDPAGALLDRMVGRTTNKKGNAQ